MNLFHILKHKVSIWEFCKKYWNTIICLLIYIQSFPLKCNETWVTMHKQNVPLYGTARVKEHKYHPFPGSTESALQHHLSHAQLAWRAFSLAFMYMLLRIYFISSLSLGIFLNRLMFHLKITPSIFQENKCCLATTTANYFQQYFT